MSEELIPDGYDDDTTQQDMFNHRVKMLANAWESTGLVVVREIQTEGNAAFHFKCRVKHNDEEKLIKGPAYEIMREFSENVDLFFGRQFFLKDNKKDLMQAFVIAAGGENLQEAMLEMGSILQRHTPRREVMAAPLSGPATPEGSLAVGVGSHGKAGARPIKA